MNELDQLINEQTPEVAKAINDLIEQAGTSDADWDVLLAAGNMIAELRNPLNDEIIYEIYGALRLLGSRNELLHHAVSCWQGGFNYKSLMLEKLKTHNKNLSDTLQWQIDSYNRVQS